MKTTAKQDKRKLKKARRNAKKTFRTWDVNIDLTDIFFEERVSDDPDYLFSFVATREDYQVAGHCFSDSIDFTKINYAVSLDDVEAGAMKMIELLAILIPTITATVKTFQKTVISDAEKREEQRKAFAEKY